MKLLAVLAMLPFALLVVGVLARNASEDTGASFALVALAIILALGAAAGFVWGFLVLAGIA